jgi:alpha-mannosidase
MDSDTSRVGKFHSHCFISIVPQLKIDRFGIRCETAWLPDSFGLTGALPQLIRGAGMKWFFTQKLSWNNINTFPHSTFNWVGIDGTQVLCHMTPVGTYFLSMTI